MKISVNMILGNRPEPYLEYALRSVLWADEFIIVNSGEHKSDNIKKAKEILKDKAFVVMDYCILGKDFDFASARNMALEASTGDFIFKIDADEVYYNSFERTVRSLGFNADIYQVEFYHFMLDVFHYQYVEKKQVLFRRDKFRWAGTTHEILEPIKGDISIINLQDKFCHFGYAQPQKNIFEKWQQYVEIEGRPDWYKGQDPEHILDDRALVSQRFNYEYPEAIRDDIKDFPVVIEEEANRMPKVGIVMIDPELEEIKIVEKTADFPIELIIVTRNPGYYIECGHKITKPVGTDPDVLNTGVKSLMEDPDIRWIGVSKTGQIKKAVEAMIENVGMVNFAEGFLVSVDVFEMIGLIKYSDFEEFRNRMIQNNLKETVL